MIERTTVRLPNDLLVRAKRKAAAEGRTLTALIEEGLRRVLVDDSKPFSKKRILPRVSKAKGGLQPGVNLDRLSEIQEEDDFEYVRRMQRTK